MKADSPENTVRASGFSAAFCGTKPGPTFRGQQGGIEELRFVVLDPAALKPRRAGLMIWAGIGAASKADSIGSGGFEASKLDDRRERLWIVAAKWLKLATVPPDWHKHKNGDSKYRLLVDASVDTTFFKSPVASCSLDLNRNDNLVLSDE